MFFIEVGFDQVKDDNLNEMLNSMPTTLELDDNEIDQIITAGRILLRKEPSYMRFVENNKGRLVDGAIAADEICRYLPQAACAR